MPIDFNQQRWNKIKDDSRKWWAGELGRPLIQVRLKGHDSKRAEPALPYHEFTSYYNLSIPAEDIVHRIDYDLSTTKYLGDGFPTFWPNFGPGVIAAFMGAKLQNGVDTVWFHPENMVEMDKLKFKFIEDNVWYQRIKNITRACNKRWDGLVLIGLTDLGGNLDILHSFRPSEHLLYDLIDSPDNVKRLTWEAHHAWWQYFEEFSSICQPFNPGYSGWTPLYSESPYYMLQCDFCYMISPAMFDEFVKPELKASADRLVNAFYHLDGQGELPHLDSLLEIDSLKGIQWVPGEGSPDVSKWPEVYKKIHDSGRLTQIFSNQYKGNPCDLLDILYEQVGDVSNVAYMIDADISQEKKILQLLKKYRVN